MENERIYVVAQEASHFRHGMRGKNLVYVERADRLLGLRKPTVILYGAFSRHPEWNAIELRLLESEAQIIEVR